MLSSTAFCMRVCRRRPSGLARCQEIPAVADLTCKQLNRNTMFTSARTTRSLYKQPDLVFFYKHVHVEAKLLKTMPIPSTHPSPLFLSLMIWSALGLNVKADRTSGDWLRASSHGMSDFAFTERWQFIGHRANSSSN